MQGHGSRHLHCNDGDLVCLTERAVAQLGKQHNMASCLHPLVRNEWRLNRGRAWGSGQNEEGQEAVSSPSVKIYGTR